MDFIKPQFSSYVSKDTRTMKSIVLTVLLVGCALAEDAPYPPSGTRPQGARFVLPTEVGSSSENRPAPQYAAPQYLAPQNQPQETENLQKVSENTLEKLRQAQGADSGSYYVYLADGRLQRVQYITAPLRQAPPQNNNQQVNLQNTQTFQNAQTLQFNQENAQANAKLQNVGQEQSQSQVQGQYAYPQPTFNNQYQQAASGQYKQQLSASQYQQQSAFNQYKQQPSKNQFNEEAASTQYSQQVPSGSYKQQHQKPEKLKQQPSAAQQAQYPQSPSGSNQYSKVSFQGASSNESPAPAQQQLYPLQQQAQLELHQPEQNQLAFQQQVFQQPEQNQLAFQQQVFQQPEQSQIAFQQQILQQPVAASYVASVQFTEVQPIATPIYSYTPTPLVRILRYAPMYQ
ncbi:putative mediator of RNA polymerase II transcription subunit 26 [Halyomorpha halys]|uniref:putative mediator of RNA polymerase II transcription subunit 26 n=1 Tax=Halyomorpha halys TaxID=286706 RepID=UPI0006D51C3C|nr:putative mediator of RNA polymerase II transcription subunit 26 [Halyomorpha halys]